MRRSVGAPSNAKKCGLIGILSVGLVIGSFSIGAAPVDYADTFDSAPFGGNPSLFTTGTEAKGLSYEGSAAGLFAWHTTFGGSIDADAFGDPCTITITSRNGAAFDFNSIRIQNEDEVATAATISGSGPDSFTISVPASADYATYSPSGGPKRVTKVEIYSSDMWIDFDDVSVSLLFSGMDVQGNETTIDDGDITPSSGDDTDLGATAVGTPTSSTFTIRSIGDADLDLTGSPYVTLSSNPSGDFVVSTQPTTDPIAPSGSDTFTVQCNPTAFGERTATVAIANNSEVSPYTFKVQCTGADEVVRVPGHA
ncbi:choice-of-anchor D domain-containing protein [Candidatus Bipolaricaulota bacterium]